MLIQLYIETSVLGAITDPGPKERIDATWHVLELIQRGMSEKTITEGSRHSYFVNFIEGHISTLVLDEIEQAPARIKNKIIKVINKTPLNILEETEESLLLSEAYIAAGAIPGRFEDDARHIAIATTNEIGVVVSWNYKHMVNLACKRLVNAENLKRGYRQLEIISPKELLFEG